MTEYSPAETGEYRRIFPNFQNCSRCEKDLKDNKHNSLHLGQKYARIYAPGLQVSLYFLYFFTSPIFSYLIQKLPIIPIMLELKGKKSIFVESCKTDSAPLAFLLSVEPVFKKFLCFFMSEGSLINLLPYKMCKLLKSLMDRFLKNQVLKETEGSTC